MKELKFYCEHCGWETKLPETELYKAEPCILCGHEMVLDDETLDELVAKDLEETELITMQMNIKENGNDKVWYDIEKFVDDPVFRIEFRNRFFKAGGVVPAKEIKI